MTCLLPLNEAQKKAALLDAFDRKSAAPETP